MELVLFSIFVTCLVARNQGLSAPSDAPTSRPVTVVKAAQSSSSNLQSIDDGSRTSGITSQSVDDLEADKRKWGENSMSVWGKRRTSYKDQFKPTRRRWGENSMSVWGKRSGEENSLQKSKRKWGENSMSVWGKRAGYDKQSLNRTDGEVEKRKWGENSMSVWGKRNIGTRHLSDNDPTTEKRKWGENSMSVWGKRSGEKRTLSNSGESKRKWGENSMSVWGKRGDNPDGQHSRNIEKRKWGENSMSVWGKRLEGALESPEEEKRRWGENSMSVWGKRSKRDTDSNLDRSNGCRTFLSRLRCGLDEQKPVSTSNSEAWSRAFQDDGLAGSKRKWGENSMLVWGKRLAGEPLLTDDTDESEEDGNSSSEKMKVFHRCAVRAKTSLELKNCLNWLRKSEKRKWDSNTMKVWGKRSIPDEMISDSDDIDEELGTGDEESLPVWEGSESSRLNMS